MTTEGEPEAQDAPAVPWRRFHRAAIAFNALRALSGLALPIVVAMFRGNGVLQVLGVGLAGALIALVAGVVRWRTNTWRVSDTAIGHREGWLNTSERSVPLARVQSLDAVRGPLQRLLGVAAVHVQTAGGAKAGEIVLPAVTPAELAELRRAAGVELAAEGTPAERRLGTGALLVAGLTAGSASLLVAGAAGAAQLGQEVFGGDGGRGLRQAEQLLPGTLGGWVLALAVLLVLAWVLGVIGTVVAFAGFTVRREGDRLRIARGLLARRETSVAVGRVRAVRVVEGVLRQPFGLAAVRIDVLGADGEPPAAQTLFPLVRRDDVGAFLDELLPERAGSLDVAPVPTRSARRYVLAPLAGGAAVAALVWLLVPLGGPWALVLPLLGAGWGLACYRAAGWRVDPDGSALRFRRLARTTVLFVPGRAQWCAVGVSPLQARAGLADVRVSLGRGARAGVRHLEAPVAWRLWQLASDRP